ncbi:hypothetical protein [Paenibacillus sp. P13VS]|uniref:hypothetical protein n=1 Tax=Paenibacillus TaxID=44249 RepID=UPI00187BC4A5|nr:hypothetical protein [Paenibacillus sp. P13VS]MBE7682437.1 hypothetical protein [Paenibacillus sp. P13VS]
MSKNEMYSVQDWMDYIEGRVTGDQAVTMEKAIIEDPEAMDNYLEAMGIYQTWPQLENPAHFADSIMERITDLNPSGSKRKSRSGRSRRWLEHKVFHYAVAACLTLIFLSSGVFDKVAPYHKFNDGEQRGSFTQKWTEAATNWLDNFKPKP